MVYNGISWTDDPTGVAVDNMYEYVSTRKKKLGKWEAFSTPSLWAKYGEKGAQGEQGPRGADGTSVTIKGSFNTFKDFEDAFGNTDGKPTIKYGDNTVEVGLGDGYLVSGNLYVCKNVSTDFDKCWQNVGPIKGESAYINLRFSDTENHEDMWDPDNGKAGKYIGIWITDHEISDGENKPENFKWSKWSGDDGWGYEQVFILTTDHYNETNPPLIDEYQKPGSYNLHIDAEVPVKDDTQYYESTKWEDLPLAPTKEYPYCWQMTRKGTDGKMPAWEKISLYNRYVKDGNDAIFEIFKIHNQMDQIFVDAENHPVVDYTFETKAVVINQDGETVLNSADVTCDYALTDNNDSVQFTIPTTSTVNSDLNITFAYNGQSQTMFIKRIQGVTEYSLEADHTYVIKDEVDTVNLNVITKTIGTGNSDIVKSQSVSTGHALTLFKNGEEWKTGVFTFNTSELKGGDVVEARLTQGDTLVDYVTIEIIETSIRFVLDNPFDQLIVNGNNQIDDPDVSSGISN